MMVTALAILAMFMVGKTLHPSPSTIFFTLKNAKAEADSAVFDHEFTARSCDLMLQKSRGFIYLSS